jgi:hypothetical protein
MASDVDALEVTAASSAPENKDEKAQATESKKKR